LKEDEVICSIKGMPSYKKNKKGNLKFLSKFMDDIAKRNFILDINADALIGSDTVDHFPMYMFMNHTNKPNVYFDKGEFKALRDIEPNNELLYDYSAVDFRQIYEFK